MDVLVVVRPADVREGWVDLEVHLGAVGRLALVGDGHPHDGLLTVPDLQTSGFPVPSGDVDMGLSYGKNY